MIQAIPTTYKGVQMRSRLEARTAKFFDDHEIRWVYEAEGFDLSGLWYLPDFWLPDLRMFVEVKGVLDEGAIEKASALVKLTRLPCLIVHPFSSGRELTQNLWQDYAVDGNGALELFYVPEVFGGVGSAVSRARGNYFSRCDCGMHCLNPEYERQFHYTQPGKHGFRRYCTLRQGRIQAIEAARR